MVKRPDHTGGRIQVGMRSGKLRERFQVGAVDMPEHIDRTEYD